MFLNGNILIVLDIALDILRVLWTLYCFHCYFSYTWRLLTYLLTY